MLTRYWAQKTKWALAKWALAKWPIKFDVIAAAFGNWDLPTPLGPLGAFFCLIFEPLSLETRAEADSKIMPGGPGRGARGPGPGAGARGPGPGARQGA